MTVLLAGCDTEKSPDEILNCQLAVSENPACTPVLSLQSGDLILKEANLSFELKADYESCFSKEKYRITGSYERRSQTKINEIELLAKFITIVDEDTTKAFPRTIGLISLDTDTNKGNFVDIWAVTQAYGKSEALTTSIEVNCEVTP
jgi:hypothetical protein